MRQHFTASIAAFILACFTLPALAGQITVTGKCRKKMNPDRASLTFNVDVLAPKPGDAQKKANGIAAEVSKVLKKMSLKDFELSTGNLSLSEDFVYENNRQRANGFRAINSLTLTSSEIDRVGEAVPLALQAGAKSFGGLTVFLSDAAYDKAYQDCLSQATANARTKAQNILSGQDKKVGDLIDLSEGQPFIPSPVFTGGGMAMSMESAKSAPGIEVRDANVESTVTAKFKF